ncbi:MAG: SRPBCC domain-containing protein [Pelobium sp.]
MKDFKKYYTIPAPPEEVYLALTIPLSIKLWSGAEAMMSAEPGSEFSLFDGDIVGKNLEFETDKKIVQQWYFEGQEAASLVTMKLHETNKKGTTSIELLHTNIPDEVYDEFADGWNTSYFGELFEFFDGE